MGKERVLQDPWYMWHVKDKSSNSYPSFKHYVSGEVLEPNVDDSRSKCLGGGRLSVWVFRVRCCAAIVAGEKGMVARGDVGRRENLSRGKGRKRD